MTGEEKEFIIVKEAIIETLIDNMLLAEGKNITTGTTTGSRFTTTASQKMAFHGSTPIVQAVLSTSASNADIVTALQNLGLVKQS